jgi:acyl carrier protein
MRRDIFFESYGVSFLNLQTTSNDVTERVRSITATQLGVSIERVIDSASFTNDLGADSLYLVELIIAFEEAFNISIPDDQAEQILTVGQAITYISKAKH